jgi:hypothetical protein
MFFNDGRGRDLDNINMELERLGFNLRLTTFHATLDDEVFGFLQPVNDWIEESSYDVFTSH